MAEKIDKELNDKEMADCSADCLEAHVAGHKDLVSFEPNEALSELEAAWEDEYEMSLRKITKCTKRYRHREFISIREFSIDHLDLPYKDESIVKLVNKMAALTVRLEVRKMSFIRPGPPYPPERRVKANGSPCIIYGTGFVDNAFTFTEESGELCPCRECLESGSPRSRWGQVDIKTAGHVIHDCFEAEETVCYFDFDEDDTDVKSIPSLIGCKQKSVGMCSYKDDQFKLICCTHDVDFAEKLKKMANSFTLQQQVLVRKYHGSSETAVPDVNFYHKVIDQLCSKIANGEQAAADLHLALNHFGGQLNNLVQENCPTIPASLQTDRNLVILVSHPHGCGKYVSLGEFKSRETIQVHDDLDSAGVPVNNWLMKSCYLYTTQTCQGSSGAPVFILSKERVGKVCTQVHSMFMGKFRVSRSGFSHEM